MGWRPNVNYDSWKASKLENNSNSCLSHAVDTDNQDDSDRDHST
jgi:hypothetical protein